MESLTNNTIQPLAIGQLWSGISEFRNNTVTIAVNLITTKNCIVTVSQATDNVNFVFTDNFAHDVAIIGTQSRFQVSAKAQFMKVSVLNDSGEDIPQIVVTTYFNDVNIDSTLEQPVIVAGSVNVLNSMKATDYEFDTLRNVACDDTGRLLTINSPSGTQDVSVTSRSGTGLLSYVTDSVSVGGTVTVPHLSYVTDSVSVGAQPPLSYVTDSVSIGGTVTVPHLSYVTDSVSVGGTVAVSSLPAITLSRTTSSITTFENNSSIISFPVITTLIPLQIKSSPGSLVSINYYNDSNSVNYILLYNALIANVTVGTTTPVAVLSLKKADASDKNLHSVLFSTAISFAVSSSFDGSSLPSGSGVYVTALYDN